MLFTCHYTGMVVVNRLNGIEHQQDDDYHRLHVAGGEDWPSLVSWCVEQGSRFRESCFDPWLCWLCTNPKYWRVWR